MNAYCIKLRVFTPSNALTKAPRLPPLFLESQDCDAARRALEGHRVPDGPSEKVREGCAAALALTVHSL